MAEASSSTSSAVGGVSNPVKTMSLTEALVTLKLLGNKIGTAAGASFVAVSKGRGDKRVVIPASKPVDVVATALQGNYDRISSLMKNRDKIKSSLVMANAFTKVNIGSVEMTLAEAIELKSSIVLKKNLLRMMQHQMAQAMNTIQVGNTKLDQLIENAALTASSAKSRGDIPAGLYDSVANPRLDAEQLALLDPINVEDKINALTAEIESFESEVDLRLSEVNAKTTIEVDLVNV